MSYYDRDRTNVQGHMSYPKTYIGNTAEYLVSGWPYVKTIKNTTDASQTQTVTFNYITSELKIQGVNTDVTVFLQGSTDSFVVQEDTTITLPVKCTTLQFTTDNLGEGITVIAALTNIPAADYPSDSWEGGSVDDGT